MLRRLTLGLFTLACAVAVVACSSGNTTPSTGGVQGQGPNFVTNTIYVTDTTQNAIDIYTPSPGPSATPQYLIGGSSTSMDGPSYLAFDSGKNLYVTNYGASSKTGSVTIYKEFATGNVVAFGSAALGAAQARGIAMIPNNGGFAVAFTQSGGFFANGIDIFLPFTGPGSALPNVIIGGSSTNLNNPIGLAIDANKNIYAANSSSGQVTVYALPSPAPTASGSPSPTPSPTPTPTTAPSGAPTASPSPTPTPFSDNIAPVTTITCTCLKQPTGLALDANGNLYVTDPGSTPAAVYEFASSGIVPGTVALTPLRILTGMANPTDVKIDSSGTLYVVDAGNTPDTSRLLIFPAGATSPSTSIKLQGTATGLALSP